MSVQGGGQAGLKASIAAILDETTPGITRSPPPAIAEVHEHVAVRFWTGFVLLAASLALVVMAASLVVSIAGLAQALLRSGLVLATLGLVLVAIDVYRWRRRTLKPSGPGRGCL